MKMKIFLTLAVFLLTLLIYNYSQISKFYVNKPVFNSDKLKEPLRITQITDYHGNTLINIDKLIKEVEKFNPHIIALTGDMIDHETEDIGRVLNLVQSLYEVNNNIFFVIGNHELRNGKGHEFISGLEKIGVTVLNDENTLFKLNENNISIVGLSFYASKEDYDLAMEGVREDNFVLLLSHAPNRPILYLSGLEDLILAGHTHGGQVRLPIIGAIIAPGQGLFPRYDKGVFELGKTILYIDSGLGNSVFPIRFFNRVQISNITIKPVGENNLE